MTTNGSASATVETLTAEVRTLVVGSRQVTLSVAKQLDRLDLFCWGPGAITPFGRVKTGAKVTQERVKAGYRHYPEHMLDSNRYFETYTTEPRVEVIGRSNRDEDRGALVIFEVGPKDVTDLYSGEGAKELNAVLAQWDELPLIVLAGLR
jgi:hypothetical protein